MQATFRVDASIAMGIGHAMRCLTLANALVELGVRTTFITREHHGHLAELMRAQGHVVLLLPAPEVRFHAHDKHAADAELLGVSWQKDADETLNALDGCCKPDWLIVDHYALDASWHRRLCKHVGRLFIIDDLANRPMDCDLLLDQTYGRRKEDYARCVEKKCRMLLGAGWALLRPEFAELRPKAIVRRKEFTGVRRVLISIGGADPDNVTGIVLNALMLIAWPNRVHIDVVLGSRAPHLQTILQQAAAHPLEVTVTNDADDMAERMLEADLAIGAGGSTSWERCCLGLPALITVCADNQKVVSQHLAEAEAALLLPAVSRLTQENIADGIKKILSTPEAWKKLSNNALKITDGMGAKRVVPELFPLYSTDGLPIRLRPIVVDDTSMLYKWQSDSRTRRFFHNSEIPAYAEHADWVNKQVNKTVGFTEIIMHGETAAGVIRLDPVEAHERQVYMVSIYVSPDKYRLGLATGAIDIAANMVPKAELRAEVSEGNVVSHALFRSSGFQCVRNGYYVKVAVR